jgi:hypothetical protein
MIETSEEVVTTLDLITLLIPLFEINVFEVMESIFDDFNMTEFVSRNVEKNFKVNVSGVTKMVE